VKPLALISSAAAAIAASRTVQSYALRLRSRRTVPADDYSVAVMFDFVNPSRDRTAVLKL
jgi:hypothetical protein